MKSQQIQERVLQENGIKVDCRYIASVLRNDIGARYKPIRKVPYLGNSIRCLQLRQFYSKFMLGQIASGVRIINLD